MPPRSAKPLTRGELRQSLGLDPGADIAAYALEDPELKAELRWLQSHLGRDPKPAEAQTFERLVGSTRESRAALVEVNDGDLMRAAWMWERSHRNRGTVVLQLRARMNTLNTPEEKPGAADAPARPDWHQGTITRPRGRTESDAHASAAEVIVARENVAHTLATLAAGIPALRAMGIRRIVLELDEGPR